MPSNLDRVRRAIVRAPNWVGDAVMATPLLRGLRRGLPGARIVIAARPYVKPVFEHGPWADSVRELAPVRGIRGLAADVRALRREDRFDLGILLPNSFSSALLFFLGGVRTRIGYRRNGRSLLLSGGPEPAREGKKIRPVPMVECYEGLLSHIGIPADGRRTELFTGPGDEAEIEKALSPAQRSIPALLAPGAAYGTSKQWRDDRFAALGDGLAEKGNAVVIVGGPADMGVCARVAGLMKRPCLDLSGRISLGAFKALVRRCAVMVSTDSGPRHFAVAFDRPVVVLMGATDPRYTDCNLEKTVIIRKQVDCGPCQLKTCPQDHRCMEQIQVEEVLAAALKARS